MKTSKLLSVLIIAPILFLASCKTNERIIEKPIETIHTEYIDRVQLRLDSIYLHDSIYIDRSRDTLLIERWHTRDVLKVKRDTVQIEKTDTIQIPVYVTNTGVKYVEKHMKWWQLILIWIGGITLVLAVIWFAVRKVKNKIENFADLQ